MSSATGSRSSRVCSDAVLSSRLRALGYSLERPSAADRSAPPAPSSPEPPDSDSEDGARPPAPGKNAIQQFVEKVEAEIARMQKSVQGPARSLEKSSRVASAPDTDADEDEASSSSAATANPPSSSSTTRRPLTLSDLLRIRATRHLPHLLALLSLSLRLVGAADSPLVATASRLAALIPGVTLSEIVDLAQSVRGDAALLTLSHGRAQASGRTFEASLSFVGDHLFSTSPKKLADPQRATLLLAKELGLYPPPLAAPTSSTSLRILSTSRSNCAQCGSSLNLPRRPSVPVYLVDPASPASLVLVATHVCTNSSCRATHTPDHVEIAYKGQKVWLWEEQPEAIKVGDRVWLSSAFARHYRAQLLNQAQSAGAIAATWSELYGEATPVLDDEVAAESSEGEGVGSARDDEAPSRRASSGPFILRQKHVWRSFVIYTCILAAADSPHLRFASLPRPLVEHLVALANSDLFSSASSSDATVLPPHSCSTCARKPHRWRGGPATEEERAQGVRWAGTHARRGAQPMKQDVKRVKKPDVQFAVCDGIEIGHPLCAAPGCRNPPDAYRRSRRFCPQHADLHLVCGIDGCDQERSDDVDDAQEPSEACENPAHQEAWRSYLERRRRLEERGWRGRRPAAAPKYALPEIDEPPDVEEEMQLYSDDDEEDLDVDEIEKKPPRKRPDTHTWNLRRTSNLQILVAACGAPLAWTKFCDGESASEVSRFLSSIHAQQGPSFPTYIAYDRACHVLRHALSTGSSLPPFLSSTRLVVTAFHKRIHPAADAFCDEFCSPTPLDGQAQDLVVPFRPATRGGKFRSGSSRTFERAFNTSAAEQLNSTIARFSQLLATLRADNFDFLVHVILRHRREKVERRAT